jgi:hypothetical protein
MKHLAVHLWTNIGPNCPHISSVKQQDVVYRFCVRP